MPPAHSPQPRPHPPHSLPPHRHPSQRRKRQRRVWWRRTLKSYGWLGVILGSLVGAMLFIGALWGAANALRTHHVLPSSADDPRPQVLRLCTEKMPRMNCTCLWDKAGSVFTTDNTAAILQVLSEREQFGPALTRGRLETVAGEDATRQLGRALYDCVRM